MTCDVGRSSARIRRVRDHSIVETMEQCSERLSCGIVDWNEKPTVLTGYIWADGEIKE